MTYFRSYFEKNNTIVKNSVVNTAKNPTTDIFYGDLYSRYIFKIDLTTLKNKVDNDDLIIKNTTKHILHLTNTIFGNVNLIGQTKSTGKDRATSFTLELFKLNESWDEGVGYDYSNSITDIVYGQKSYDDRPSNWNKRDTINDWTIRGAFDDALVIDDITFDNGNENIDIDITEYVNGILLSGQTNYGLGLKFHDDYEALEEPTDKSVSFFTKYTQTFFEPYLETVFDDVIEDSRNNFIENKIQKLYLYVNKGNNYYNLDTLPTVDILDNTGTPITALTGLTTTHVRKGIYEVSFGITGIVCDGKKFFYDKWKGVSIDDVDLNDITQKFVPKQYTSLYNIGGNITGTNNYVLKYSGIQQNEKIKRGETRKVIVNFNNITQEKNQVFNEVYYRTFIYEGKTEVSIHDWTKFDMTNELGFTFDTSYYIPREYHIEIKGKINNEEIFYNNRVKFEIISEK